jgi:hypothetical protein
LILDIALKGNVMITIDIDSEVWARLQESAEPFVDDPNSVLRKLLNLDGDGPSAARRRTGGDGGGPGGLPMAAKGERAPLGSLLPEDEYELPILQELALREGSAPAREITKAVGERLGDRLMERDWQRLRSGDIRWENRVHFTRLTLRKRGLIKAGSPRGTWELTEKGWKAAEGGEAV